MLIKIGDRGQAVRQVQILLNAYFSPKPRLVCDGSFGQATERAVMEFQRRHNLTPDGQVGPVTWEALGMKSQEKLLPKAPATNKSWLDIAAAEIGVHEDSRQGKNNRRILEYHATTTLKATDDETAWCSSFVNWVVIQSGQRGTNSAAAKSWLGWGKKLGKPQAGSIIVIKKKTGGFTNATGSHSGYHVGFLVSASENAVRILGGNQSDQVKYSNFPLSHYTIEGCIVGI